MSFLSLFEMQPLKDQQTRLSLWGISWMSFFWSTSSLMVFSFLPFFITQVLGASKTQLGFIEGFAIFLAFISKVFSGVISDYFRHRKPLIAIGSLFTVLVKIIFATAGSVYWIFAARSIDRLSKGIRSAPTDALIADHAKNTNRGESYGLRQALYTLGAVAGSFIAIVLMTLTDKNYRIVFALAAIPAAIALILLLTIVKQPPIQNEVIKSNRKWKIADIAFLPKSFWYLLGITFILMLARFSEAFIILHAQAVGWSIEYVPALIVAMDLVHAAVAYPVGRLADKTNRYNLFLKGIIVLIVTNMVFVSFQSVTGVLIASLLAGLHMGITQVLISTLVAESTPAELRGTAFALYYLSSGTAVLIGNTTAGHLSDTLPNTAFGLWLVENFGVGAASTGAFWGGLGFTTLASIALYFYIRKRSSQELSPAVQRLGNGF